MTACNAAAGPASLARDILASTDCFIIERVQSAYSVLLAPSGNLAHAITLALAIYVAIFGIRLILGYSSLTLSEVVPHFLKIGLVLALATSWPAYQVLVFDLLFNGPGLLANDIIRQLGGSQVSDGAEVIATLQSVFDLLADSAADAWTQSAAAPATDTMPTAPVPGEMPSPAPVPVALPFQMGAPQFVAIVLWLSALMMMATSVGVLLTVKIILALLLILGPLFIACGLFSGTRGLFEGWLRIAVKFSLVPLFTLPLTATMLAVVLPFAASLDNAPIESFRDGPAISILIIAAVFAAVLFQAVRIVGGIADGIRLPHEGMLNPAPATRRPADVPTERSNVSTSRTETMFAVLNDSSGREGRFPSGQAAGLLVTRMISPTVTPAAPQIDSSGRLGQGYRRLAITTAPSSMSA